LDSEFHWFSDDSGTNELSEFEDNNLLVSMQQAQTEALEQELKMLKKLTVYEKLTGNFAENDWKKAEKKRGLGGYTGNAMRTKQQKEKKVMDKEKIDKKLRNT
jgi:hypothetical protein